MCTLDVFNASLFRFQLQTENLWTGSPNHPIDFHFRINPTGNEWCSFNFWSKPENGNESHQ
jgi:hypothetical protein